MNEGKKKRMKRGGFTLIELIISFALTAILMTSAAMVLSSYMRAFIWCNAAIQSRTVSDILMDTISAELNSAIDAQAIPVPESGGGESVSDIAISLSDYSEGAYRKIILVDSRGNNLQIAKSDVFVEDDKNIPDDDNIKKLNDEERNRLVLRYIQYAIDSNGIKTDNKRKQMNWQYGVEAYKGNIVTQLGFNQIGDDSLIRVTLTMKNEKTEQEYELNRIVECYNIPSEKISKT